MRKKRADHHKFNYSPFTDKGPIETTSNAATIEQAVAGHGREVGNINEYHCSYTEYHHM